ncbi:hypothetical protein [Streptomyces sp. NPDC002644]
MTSTELALSAREATADWERWYRDHIPLAEQLYREYVSDDED